MTTLGLLAIVHCALLADFNDERPPSVSEVVGRVTRPDTMASRDSSGLLTRATASQQPPDGLSSSDWSGIRAAYEAGRHAVVAVEGGYLARNPGQKWRTRFDDRGFVTTPDAGGWSWGLDLVGYGRADAERGVQREAPARVAPQRVAPVFNRCESSAPRITTCGQRVEYQWDDALTEWYINDPRGLEHGYTVHHRPPSEPSHDSSEPSPDRKGGVLVPPHCDRPSACKAPSACSPSSNAPLHFTLAIRGDLRPRINADGRGVTFVNDDGAAVVNYAGLKVFDADGTSVPAWFEPSGESLRLHVDDRAARYPLTIDPIAQQAYLKSSNTGASDVFGYSVSVSGDTVVVGALSEDSNATGVNGDQANNGLPNAGAAYVFVRSGSVWTQQGYLKASNTGATDLFGYSVSVSGDTVVVGAQLEDSNATGVNGDQANNSATDSGAAYVFVRSGGVWTQQAYLKASNTGGSDNFGYSVSVSGDTVVVGARAEDSNATGVNGDQANNGLPNAGAAYVFVRSGTTWSQQAYLKASNTGGSDFFGYSVSVSGDTVVVGAYGEDSNATGVNGNQADNSAADSGAAYVFVRSGGVWTQQAYLKASNTGAGDLFGISVSVSGDTVVVGAGGVDSTATGVNGNQADNLAGSSGAAYVFVRSGTTWTQQAYLKASNTGANDEFGFSVSVSGDTVAVGAGGEDSNAMGVNGNQADNSAGNSGAAYVFVRSGGVWTQQAYLKASNTGASDFFGQSVSVSGDTVVVGADEEDSNATGVNGNGADNSAGDSGAAYVFDLGTCPTFGNMNCDCAVDLGDVPPFVQALLDPAGYAAAYPACSILNGDMQPDGNVDGADVQGFADLLIP